MAINSVLATLNENGRKLCSANVLAPSVIDIEINEKQIRILLDIVLSECFMTPKLAKELNLKIDRKFKGSVVLADKTHKYDVRAGLNILHERRALLGRKKFGGRKNNDRKQNLLK